LEEKDRWGKCCSGRWWLITQETPPGEKEVRWQEGPARQLREAIRGAGGRSVMLACSRGGGSWHCAAAKEKFSYRRAERTGGKEGGTLSLSTGDWGDLLLGEKEEYGQE